MNNPIVRRITATLFASQSLAQVALTAALTVGPIAAKRISGSPSLAGLPTTILLLGTA
ncbi:MAG: MFS transporter, partial [Chloroflexi bacterium]|nr:MFS transporter [Chloroflexota bacterium]